MNPFTENSETINAITENRILRGSEENYRSSIHYKALAYRRDLNIASMTYDIKGARAFFDPNLGPSGGWRCPVGTRYGGQITDRYGRNCGWGVARRLANTITDTGERLERRLDKRRVRRVERRNQRVARRISASAQGVERRGRQIERAVTPRGRAVAPPSRQRRGIGRPEQMERAAEEVLQGTFLENRRRRRAARAAERAVERQNRPRTQRQRRGAGLPERMERAANEVLEGTFLENRRRRRSERARREAAQIERTTPSGGNRRPATPSRPAGQVQRRTRRTGSRIDIGEPGSDRRRSADQLIGKEKQKVNDFWSSRLGGRPVNQKNIREYVAEREQRGNVTPAYLNTLRARERDHKILNGTNPERKVDDLSPSARRRIKDGLSASPASTPAPESPAPATPRPRTPRPRTPRPEPRVTPETNQPPSKPKPQAPRPVGPRTSDRRIIRVEDLSDNPVERRKLRKEAEEEVKYKERLLGRQRLRLVADNNAQGLTRHIDQLEAEEERLNRVADDKSRDVVTRYRAREVGRLYGKERRLSIEARDRVRERRRTAQEAAQAPEAPKAPKTPRAPEAGRRVNTFGLSKEQRAKLDRFIEDDHRARQNQASEVADLFNRNDPRVDNVLKRRLNDADQLLAEYERDIANDNADPSDRYVAQQSIERLRIHRNSLRILQDGRRGRGQTTPTPESPTPPPTPSQPDAPDLLVPDAKKQKELRAKFAERKKAILDKRQKVISNYMKKRYGSGKAPWKDRTQNHDIATLSRLLDEARDSDLDKRAAATLELQRWAKQIYDLPEFEGKDGMKFRSRVSASVGPDSIGISGNIQAYDEGTQRWRNIGEISRTIKIRERIAGGGYNPDFKPYVKNGLLKITSPRYKNSGFASVYNPHAFTWLKAAGFQYADVSTAWDGKFVWGKMGYRESSAKSRMLADRLEQEVKRIRQGGTSSILRKRDVDVIAALIDEARRKNYDIRAPQHAEYLIAMSNRDNPRVKSWFTNNAPFDQGQFYFDEIPDDPRS